MKHLGLAAPEQHQYLHHHVHFTSDHLSRMTDEQLDRAEAAYTVIVALEQEVAAAEAQRASFGTRPTEQPRYSSHAARPTERHMMPAGLVAQAGGFGNPILNTPSSTMSTSRLTLCRHVRHTADEHRGALGQTDQAQD